MDTHRTYQVIGMTCDHCVRAVTEEVAAITGVTEVQVDLPSGRVDVTSTRELDRDEMVAAIDEAGYELAS